MANKVNKANESVCALIALFRKPGSTVDELNAALQKVVGRRRVPAIELYNNQTRGVDTCIDVAHSFRAIAELLNSYDIRQKSGHVWTDRSVSKAYYASGAFKEEISRLEKAGVLVAPSAAAPAPVAPVAAVPAPTAPVAVFPVPRAVAAPTAPAPARPCSCSLCVTRRAVAAPIPISVPKEAPVPKTVAPVPKATEPPKATAAAAAPAPRRYYTRSVAAAAAPTVYYAKVTVARSPSRL